MMASKVFVDSYLKGRALCAKDSTERSQVEVSFLQQWLLERSKLFKTIRHDDFCKISKHVSLKVVKQGQLLYRQEEVVESFYIILRGSVSLMNDPLFRAKQLAAQSALSEQIVSNPDGTKKSIIGISSKLATHKQFAAKVCLGVELEKLQSGDFFGQEALLQKCNTSNNSAIANEHTELLIVSASVFEDTLLPSFEMDLYNKALYLANLDLFSNWPPNRIRQLALSMRDRTFRYRECLGSQYLPFSHVFLLKSGSVKLSAGSDSKVPQELLNRILPPRDHVSESLAEAPRKRILPKRRTTFLPTGSSRISDDSRTRSRATPLRHRPLSAPPLERRKTESTKKVLPQTQRMGFWLREPSPQSTSDICCLGPGEMVNHIEAICKVKHSLFNAVSLSDTVVYTINTYTFMCMLEKESSHTFYSLTKKTIDRAQMWYTRHNNIMLLKPLLEVLQQTIKQPVAGKAFKRSKKPSAHMPEKRAYIAVIELGRGLRSGFQMCTEDVTVNDLTQTKSSTLGLAYPLTAKQQCFVTPSWSLDNQSKCLYTKNQHTSFDSPLPRNHFPNNSLDTSETTLSLAQSSRSSLSATEWQYSQLDVGSSQGADHRAPPHMYSYHMSTTTSEQPPQCSSRSSFFFRTVNREGDMGALPDDCASRRST